jgi:protein-S-isoprenylcysteine O-methyltransferase Ste14
MATGPDPTDSAGVRVPPLFIYLAFLAAGIGLDRLWRLHFLPAGHRRWPGQVVAGLGCALIVWTLVLFLTEHVSPEPTRPARTLIFHGPFGFTRNPIYLGGMIAFLGGALVSGSIWLLVAMVPLALVVQRVIIPREEQYLERRFGAEYRAYAARVRRWI